MKKSRRKKARMNRIHFKVLLVRYLRQIVTSVPTLLSLLLQAPVMLVIVSLVYRPNSFVNPELAPTANMTLFVLVFMAALMGILNSYREICKEREILGREVYGGLDVTSYVSSKLVVLAIVGLIQCILLVGGSFLFIDFHMNHAFFTVLFYLLAMFLTNVSVASIGLLISALLKKSESAILPVLLIIIMQVVFSDIVVPLSGIATWFNYVTPTMWGVSVLGNLFHINDMLYYHIDIYDYNALFALLPLVAIILVCYALTVIKLKRAYRTRD